MSAEAEATRDEVINQGTLTRILIENEINETQILVSTEAQATRDFVLAQETQTRYCLILFLHIIICKKLSLLTVFISVDN